MKFFYAGLLCLCYLVFGNEFPLCLSQLFYRRSCSNLSYLLLTYGRDGGILFMEKFAISYDVITDHMFHFLGEGWTSSLFILHFCAISALLEIV